MGRIWRALDETTLCISVRDDLIPMASLCGVAVRVMCEIMPDADWPKTQFTWTGHVLSEK